MPHHKLSSEVEECIDLCRECEKTCLSSIEHCLELGGRHARPEHIGLLVDCADICGTSARFMIRDSHLHPRVCASCADVCEACAMACESLSDDQMMRQCADACRRCAESCRRMSTMAA